MRGWIADVLRDAAHKLDPKPSVPAMPTVNYSISEVVSSESMRPIGTLAALRYPGRY